MSRLFDEYDEFTYDDEAATALAHQAALERIYTGWATGQPRPSLVEDADNLGCRWCEGTSGVWPHTNDCPATIAADALNDSPVFRLAPRFAEEGR